MKRTAQLPALLSALLCSTSASATTPAFDRPGIAFSVTTLPPHSFAWEQGLPDVVRNSDGGATETLYSADTLLRAGLSENLELQVSHAAYNYLRISDNGQTLDQEGAGDTGISLKYALPDLGENLAWALLGGLTIDTGKEPFSTEDTIRTLGTTLEWSLSDARALAFYLNVDEFDGETAITFSPSCNFSLNSRTDAYIELGYTRLEKTDDDIIGGAGITWMAADAVQLDFYVNTGLTSASTDLLAGFGVSVFIE